MSTATPPGGQQPYGGYQNAPPQGGPPPGYYPGQYYPPPKSGMTGKVLLGVGLAALVLVIGVVMTGLGKARAANGLEETLRQEEQTYTSTLEKITRTIAGRHHVAQEYPDQMKAVITGLVKGREGGAMVKGVVENYPQFDAGLLKDVSQAVEANRAEFNAAYKAYGDHAREYNTLIRDPLWGSNGVLGAIFMGRRDRIDPEPIISTRTAEAQRTRRSDTSDFDEDFSAKKKKPAIGQSNLGKAQPASDDPNEPVSNDK